jgi:hypothetical protein
MVNQYLSFAISALLVSRHGVNAQGCTVSSYSALKAASSCKSLIIKNLDVPRDGSIDLNLQAGSTVRARVLYGDFKLRYFSGDIRRNHFVRTDTQARSNETVDEFFRLKCKDHWRTRKQDQWQRPGVLGRSRRQFWQ